jgi:hypothetical protein
MIDPRSCDGCRRDAEHRSLSYELAVDPDTGRVDHRGRYCPRCASRVRRRHPTDPADRIAAEDTRALLEARFGAPLRIHALAVEPRSWLILCRRRPLRAADLRRDPRPGALLSMPEPPETTP